MTGRKIITSILRDVILSVAAGTFAGLVITMFATRLLAHLLYGVTASDSVALGSAIGVLVVFAALAALAPARLAVKVDPASAIKVE